MTNTGRRKRLRDGVLMGMVWIGAVLIIGIAGVWGKGGNGSPLKSVRQVQPFKMVIDRIDPPLPHCTSCEGYGGIGK